MTLKAQILIIVILLLAMIMIIYMVKKRALELKYVLTWLACDVALLIFSFFPHLMDVVAQTLGIRAPINMLFFFGFIFSLIIIFSLTVALSRVTSKVRRMAQEIALLENKTRNKKNTA